MMLGDTPNALTEALDEPAKPAAFVVVCPGCTKRNRVSVARVREQLPKCGACGAGLVHGFAPRSGTSV